MTDKSKFISITEQIPLAGDFDVIVCGGGVAGLAAAVCAGRNGAKTLLIEKTNALGGTATNSLMALSVVSFNSAHGFPREFYKAMGLSGGFVESDVTPWDPEIYKSTALRFLQEAGVHLLLNTWISGPLMDQERIKGLFTISKSGRQYFSAKVVVDCTGDCDVGVAAGAAYTLGRERDGAMRPMTVMGRLGNVDLLELKKYVVANPDDFGQDDSRKVVDIEKGIVRIDGFYSVVERGKSDGVISDRTPINYLRFSGFVRSDPRHTDLICNSTRVYGVDGTDNEQLTFAEIEGRRQLEEIVHAIQAYLPGFKDSYLIETSNLLGVRETRRIIGHHVLTNDDILNKRTFADSVAVMPSRNYGTAEVHGPDGNEGSRDDTWAREMAINTIFFEFPFRCLVPKTLKNLLVAGRCISMSHEADRFARNQIPAALSGQVAGVAAALCAKANTSSCLDVDMDALQLALKAGDVMLKLDEIPEVAYS